MDRTHYSMSFTSGTLLYRESITISGLYGELGDWEAVRKQVVAENRLQMRTLNASKRIAREVCSRLKLLTELELDLVREGTQQEQQYMLWLAVCKRYRFIYDFAVEVMREKFLRYDFQLIYADYDIFFNAKAEWHPEVGRVAVATRSKLRQVIFKMLHEAELIANDDRILPVLLTPRLIATIRHDSVTHFALFPASDSDMREWSK